MGMRRLLGGVATLLVLLAVASVAGVAWAVWARDARLARTWATHRVDFPVPLPGAFGGSGGGLDAPSSGELPVDLEPGSGPAPDPTQGALARARHLLEARYPCAECHGKDFGGGPMVDTALIGRWYGPNLTSGRGGVVAAYTVADWDRIVRHGVRPDGTAAVMPSEDFAAMSDEELADIIAYVRALPPVDREVPPRSFGPLGTLLVANGTIRLSAESLAASEQHPERPPSEADRLAFGRHVAQTCTGCHGAAFAGGPIPGAPPEWPPASSLRVGGALEGWSYEQFRAALRDGVRPDGSLLRSPMAELRPYGSRMTDGEIRSLFLYLRSVGAGE